jgi:cation diffusion facilitator CzcD-associated flavoprotein CzcO
MAKGDQGTAPLDGSFDVVIVGAGFAGMYMLHRARRSGLTARVLERGGDVGGTWYWNRYPGARCDVESVEYSYQFDDDLQQEWDWSERYATQPEILAYAAHVADRFDLRRDMRFGTTVEAATWDDDARRWHVRTDSGELTGRFLVMATGCLSSANVPDLPGLGTFAGETYHTGRWPHEGVDLTGKRVGVVGTGSSGIQSIPVIAEQALELTVFQRTPAYTVPAHNRPLDPAELAEIKASYPELRAADARSMVAFGARVPANEGLASMTDPADVERIFEERWEIGGLLFLGAFADLIVDPAANELAADFVRRKIRSIVHDPDTAETLTPHTVIGCKRLCVDSGYYATFNRPNVHLVDVSGPGAITEVTPTGLRAGGIDHELDVIVFATGFDAMTGALLAVDVRGRDGATLREAWAEGPRTYLGLGTVGFPNLFTITGPGSPSVLTNMLPSIEHHVEWIGDCLDHLAGEGLATIEATPEAQDAWVEHVNTVASFTLYPSCNSWYLGANVPGKPRVFMPLPGFPPYVERCSQVAADGYEGFALGR